MKSRRDPESAEDTPATVEGLMDAVRVGVADTQVHGHPRANARLGCVLTRLLREDDFDLAFWLASGTF